MKLAASIAILCITARSAASEPLRISVSEAIRMAIGHGTQSELARSSEERARIARGEALGVLLPQASARVQRYNQSINLATFGFNLPGVPQIIGPFNVTDAQIAAAMQVFNLAALRHYQALRQEEAASRFDTEQAENDVAAAVARLYVLLQRTDAQIASRQADLTLFERLVSLAQDEFKAGTGTRLDVAQANVQLSRARTALLIAQNDRQSARLALLNAIGADESSDLILTDPLVPPTTTPSVDPSLARAGAQRPELRQAETRRKEAELSVQAAKARRIPAISFDFEGDMSGNRNDDLRSTRRFAGTLDLPLYRADINANIARARLGLHDAETILQQRRRDVEQDVRRSLLTLENAESRVAVATENVRVAEEALTVARDRRSAGYGSVVEVDRAQDAYRQAHEDLIAAEADAVAAQFDYDHATGDIHRYAGGAATTSSPGGSAPETPRTPSGQSSSTPDVTMPEPTPTAAPGAAPSPTPPPGEES
jgi:outer membrane protein